MIRGSAHPNKNTATAFSRARVFLPFGLGSSTTKCTSFQGVFGVRYLVKNQNFGKLINHAGHLHICSQVHFAILHRCCTLLHPWRLRMVCCDI
jgi:hypothetical protein